MNENEWKNDLSMSSLDILMLDSPYCSMEHFSKVTKKKTNLHHSSFISVGMTSTSCLSSLLDEISSNAQETHYGPNLWLDQFYCRKSSTYSNTPMNTIYSIWLSFYEKSYIFVSWAIFFLYKLFHNNSNEIIVIESRSSGYRCTFSIWCLLNTLPSTNACITTDFSFIMRICSRSIDDFQNIL